MAGRDSGFFCFDEDAMKFKVNMECVYTLPKKIAKEWHGTADPQEIAKRELPSTKAALSQPMFKNMKVTVKPIAG